MDINSDKFVENLIFFYVIKNYTLTNQFKDVYFGQDALRKMFRVIKPYVQTYQEEPNENLVVTLVRQDGRYVQELTPDIIHSYWEIRPHLNSYSDEWLKATALGYAEFQNFINGVQNMYSYMLNTQYDVTPETAKDYVNKVKSAFFTDTSFALSTSMGHDFFDPKEHMMSIVETVSTGYPFFDQCLRGGWAKKTLNVIMGPPKVGKSMWLCNLAANSVMNGDNSAYITLEMSSELVNQRIGSNLLNIPMNSYEEYAKDENFMSQKFRELHQTAFGNNKRLGALIVEEFPTSSATFNDIENFLLNYEKEKSTPDKPFKFRNVFIDYINIMADARHGNSTDTYTKIKAICEDVRAMAQRNDWCVISLTQTNRTGMGASDLDMTAVSESSGLVATVDAMFGIICTTMMKAQGIYYIKALALRNSPNMGDRKKFNFSSDFLRISEDPTEPIIPEGEKLPDELTAAADQKTQQPSRGKWRPAPVQQQATQPSEPQIATVKTYNDGNGNWSLGAIENQLNAANLFGI